MISFRIVLPAPKGYLLCPGKCTTTHELLSATHHLLGPLATGRFGIFDDGDRQDRIFFARRILSSGEMRNTNQTKKRTRSTDRKGTL
jgi:hypothetical protein